MRWLTIWILCLLTAGPAFGQALSQAGPPSPPTQPTAGPGGSGAYVYDRVCVTRYGRGADTYWLFEPTDADKAKPMPVVLYAHGLNLPHYGVSMLWIRHLVRRGNLVVYPKYQQGSIVDPGVFTDVTAKAMRDALERMDGKRHVEADTSRFAMVGHSLGGTIIMNLAARPKHYGLPTPGVLMPVQPGDVRAARGLGAFLPKAKEDHATVAAGTLLLIIASPGDRYVGTSFAEAMYHETALIAEEDKDLLLIGDDDRGRPTLSADHFMPLAYTDRAGRRNADAYDFALWRWLDALMDAAFEDGKNRHIALGGTVDQLRMGEWSDGTPVRQPQVYKPEEAP